MTQASHHGTVSARQELRRRPYPEGHYVKDPSTAAAGVFALAASQIGRDCNGIKIVMRGEDKEDKAAA